MSGSLTPLFDCSAVLPPNTLQAFEICVGKAVRKDNRMKAAYHFRQRWGTEVYVERCRLDMTQQQVGGG